MEQKNNKKLISIYEIKEFNLVVNFLMQHSKKIKLRTVFNQTLCKLKLFFPFISSSSLLEIFLNRIEKPIKIFSFKRGPSIIEQSKYIQVGFGLSSSLIKLAHYLKNIKLKKNQLDLKQRFLDFLLTILAGSTTLNMEAKKNRLFAKKRKPWKIRRFSKSFKKLRW